MEAMDLAAAVDSELMHAVNVNVTAATGSKWENSAQVVVIDSDRVAAMDSDVGGKGLRPAAVVSGWEAAAPGSSRLGGRQIRSNSDNLECASNDKLRCKGSNHLG